MNKAEKILCVQACINCYKSKHGDENWSFFDKDSVEWFDIENADGYTGYVHREGKDDIFLIAHTGSSNMDENADWKTNFDTGKVKYKIEEDNELVSPYPEKRTNWKIQVHKGFYEYYYLVRSMLRKKVLKALDKNCKIFITGHSLGGAITTLNFIDIHYMLKDELDMNPKDILFGYAASAPAVGNGNFVKSFNKRAGKNFHNEWYGNDTVHSVPPWWMGYRHVENQKRYADFWTNLQAVVFEPLSLFGTLPKISVWDHRPQSLLKAIEKSK